MNIVNKATTNIGTEVKSIDDYKNDFHTEWKKAPKVVEQFYNIATDFYEYGWGESFHFAPRFKTETFRESIARHEYYLASELGLKPGMKVVDLGCGVAGPLRNIVRFSRAHVTGLTCTEYQVKKANRNLKRQGLSQYGVVVSGDYHNQPFKDNSFDRSYDVEASLHSNDLNAYFSEIFRTLKPGGRHAGYFYIWADNFDPENNPLHKKIGDEYLIGNGCPACYKWDQVSAAIKKSGLNLIRNEDLAKTGDVPWYRPLQPNYTSLTGFAATPLGMNLTSVVTWTLETLKLGPHGMYDAHTMLVRGGWGIRRAGELGLLTPMMFYMLEKPM